MLTIYRRHKKGCAHRNEGREYEKCHCPIWAQGTLGKKSYRRTLDTGSWQRASEIVREKEAAGKWDLEPPPAPVAGPTWAELAARFTADAEQRIALGSLRASTWTRYQHTIELFGAFLADKGISNLAEITKPLIEDFKAWRFQETRKVKQSRGGRGVVLDMAILHRVFAYAVEPCEMLLKNPVARQGTPGDNAENGAQPFTADELGRMREHAGPDMLAFLLLRHTGLRGGDAAGLTWGEVDLDAEVINRLTQKRRKRVAIPISTELLFALEAEHQRRNPRPDDRVLLMEPGKPFTRPKLYNRIVALGNRAGVPHAHPHRFRDTFAVDMLTKGDTAYSVAQLLADTVETVEAHYATWVKESIERARRIMKNGEGLEKQVGTPQVHAPTATQSVQ